MNNLLQQAEGMLAIATQGNSNELILRYLDVPSTITSSIDAIRTLYRRYYVHRIHGVPQRFQRQEYWTDFIKDLEIRITSFQKQIVEQDPYPVSGGMSREISGRRTQLQYRQRGKGHRNNSMKRGRR